MYVGLSRLLVGLLTVFLAAAGGSAQEPACCILVPEGVEARRVDEAPIPTNLREIADSLEANRPSDLDGMSSAVVWLHVGADGSVLETRIHTGSGSPPLDTTFLRIASVFRFSPARLANEPIDVWIQLPFTIQARDRKTG